MKERFGTVKSTHSDLAQLAGGPFPFPEAATLSDSEVIERVVRGERELFGALVQRYNQRLFRLVRSIVRPDAEAEDALQEAYLNAFTWLDRFEGRSSFPTWISRIAIRIAGARRKRTQRMGALHGALGERGPTNTSADPSPEEELLSSELRTVLESSIDSLPAVYRSVVVMRLVEGLSTAETAELLDVSEEVVRIRLHRGRAKLRQLLAAPLESELAEAFAFAGQRCQRMVEAVLTRIEAQSNGDQSESRS